jgi:H+/Cl- antiporter ClcA
MEQDPVKRRLSGRFQVNMVWEGALVGLVGGAVVTLYRLSLSGAESLLRQILSLCSADPLLIAGWFAVLALVLLVVSRLMVWEPYTQGSGIPQVDVEVMGRIDMPWHRVLAAKFAEGTLCTFAGLSLGREGPAVQIGGMAGKAVSRGLHLGRGEERILVTCGASAGMATAFHAPLTGVMFALEEIHKSFSAPLVVSVMSSCVVADFFVSQVLGIKPVLTFHFASDLPHASYWLVLLMGIMMGALGALHNVGMFWASDRLSRISRGAPYTRLIVPFALAGIIGFVAPELLCGGDAIVAQLESGTMIPLVVLLALLVGKYLYTTICFGSGAPGGTLFPLVVMGALAGAIFGTVCVDSLGMSVGYITNFMMLGVAALFAGVVRSPVTAIVLVFELTGSFDALLSLSMVSIVSYVTANLLKVDPFYEHLVARLMGMSSEEAESVPGRGAYGKVLRTYVIEVGSFLVGKQIREVPWPARTLVVEVQRSGETMLATGGVRLQALDRILVLMDGTTEDDSEIIVRGLARGILKTHGGGHGEKDG